MGDTAFAVDVLRATRRAAGPYRCVHADDLLVPRFPRGAPANRIYDYVHAGATVRLPAADAPAEDAAVRVAPVGDAPGCSLREVDPRYDGLFPPLDVRRWRASNLGAFALAEARTLLRLFRVGLAPHFKPAYDRSLCRLLAADADTPLDAAGAHADAPTPAPAALSYEELAALVWDGERRARTRRG